MSQAFEDVLLALVDALEASEIDYVLVGAIAVIAWGDPRTTRDIDVIARLGIDDLSALQEQISARGFGFDRPGAETAIRQGSHFTVFHDESIFHADVLPASEDSHERTLEARRRVEIQGRGCWIASPEDTVANKLVFGSERDLQDAAGILVRLGDDIDPTLLRNRCERLGVADDLRDLRERIDRADG